MRFLLHHQMGSFIRYPYSFQSMAVFFLSHPPTPVSGSHLHSTTPNYAAPRSSSIYMPDQAQSFVVLACEENTDRYWGSTPYF